MIKVIRKTISYETPLELATILEQTINELAKENGKFKQYSFLGVPKESKIGDGGILFTQIVVLTFEKK